MTVLKSTSYLTTMLVESETLPIGELIINFDLPSVNGENYSPQTFIDKKGIMILFTCNHCPYAKAAWPIIIDLYKKYGQEIGFIAVNANDAENYPEDSFENMKSYAVELGVEFPYVYDESQEVAKAYKAVCTPDPFLFKKSGEEFKLFYHGRVNDNWKNPEEVTEHSLDNALERVINDQPPLEEQYPSMGCSIKWKE